MINELRTVRIDTCLKKSISRVVAFIKQEAKKIIEQTIHKWYNYFKDESSEQPFKKTIIFKYPHKNKRFFLRGRRRGSLRLIPPL